MQRLSDPKARLPAFQPKYVYKNGRTIDKAFKTDNQYLASL